MSKRVLHTSDITLLINTFVLNKNDELFIIWLDDSIEPEIHQILKELHTHTDTCSTIQQLTDLINDLTDYKIILIIAGRYSQEIVTNFQHNNQIDSIFIFCIERQLYQHHFDDRTNIKLIGIYTEYKSLFQFIEKRMRSLLKHLSIFKIIEQSNRSMRNLEHESAYYAWYQLLHDSLISIEPETSKKEMLEYCRFYYANDRISLRQIDQFEQTYNLFEAIRWYTNNYFPFNFINKALRSEDIDALYNLRSFIICLSKQLQELYNKNRLDMHRTHIPYLKVYRGLTLSDEDIDRLKTMRNQYVSTNGFLSTSLSRTVAEMFASNVLFEIPVDPKQSSKNLIYANISHLSQIPDEQEVLFDLGVTFKITDINSDGNQWIVSMIAVADIDCIQNIYIDRERELLEQRIIDSNSNFQSILTFGMYLMQMGQYEKSIVFLKNLRNRTRLYEYERYFVLKGLARCHMLNKQQDLALQYALAAYQINRFILPNDMKDIELLLGRIYSYREEYDLALQCYERSITEDSINDNPDLMLEIHTNMAIIYFSSNNLTDGLEHSQK
ncbi:hypothetical protein I4U23_015264 [Adineta vaga]|nr:hypothetical protein I4U23_015264 [Adineta vaga]